jgi:hypothetical protein
VVVEFLIMRRDVARRVFPPMSVPCDLLATIESHTAALTIEEVALMFKVSPETIRRMAVKKHIGGAFKFSGSWRFNPASLGYWLRSRDPLAAKASRALASDVRQTAAVN